MPAFALIIGIDDYRHHDRDAGLAPGTSDLRGAVNDARAGAVTARLLGFLPRDIRVLTTPGLTAQDLASEFHGRATSDVSLDGAYFGEATRDEVLAGLDWLREALSTPSSRGLLLWSGHGDVVGGEGVLCPADTGADLSAAIAYTEVVDHLRGISSRDLTVLLDACHVGGMGRGTLTGATLVSTAPRFGRHAAVLAACAPDGVSYEHHFQGRWHGAFTFALTTVLERWERRTGDGYDYVAISHRELLQRTAGVLRALHFDQSPRFEGTSARADGPCFALPGLRTDDYDPAEACRKEIDPSQGTSFQSGVPTITGLTLLSLHASASATSPKVGWVVAVGDDDVTVGTVTWKAATSYWWWSTDFAPTAQRWHGWPKVDFWAYVDLAGPPPPSKSGALAFENGGFVQEHTGQPSSGHYCYLGQLNPATGELAFVGAIRLETQGGSLSRAVWYQKVLTVQGTPAPRTWFFGQPQTSESLQFEWKGDDDQPNVETWLVEEDDVVDG